MPPKTKKQAPTDEFKLCPSCGRTLAIKAFKPRWNKEHTEQIRAKICRDCASKKEVTERRYEDSQIHLLKVQVRGLQDQVDQLVRDRDSDREDMILIAEQLKKLVSADVKPGAPGTRK